MTTRADHENNSYTVAGAIAAVIMGVKNAQADPLAWAEATHLLVQYRQPYFLKTSAAEQLLKTLSKVQNNGD